MLEFVCGCVELARVIFIKFLKVIDSHRPTKASTEQECVSDGIVLLWVLYMRGMKWFGTGYHVFVSQRSNVQLVLLVSPPALSLCWIL